MCEADYSPRTMYRATSALNIGRLVVDKLAERFTMGQPPAYGR